MGILKIYYGVLLLTAILNIPGSESRAIEGNMHTVPKMKTKSHISNTEETNHCTDNGICRCRRSNDKVLVADCSYLKLTTIPTFHPDVSVIHLQGNELQQLSGQGIPKAVSFLDLSENKLNSFVGLPFKDMNRLKNLNLSNNKLQYRNSIFSDDVFHGLTSLIHLNMKQNNIEFSLRNVHFPSGISNLTTLEELFLDGVDLSGFDVKFLMLKKLKTLSLSGDTGVCHLGVLRSDFFTNVPNVETLDISNCNIHRIDLETFRCLENLRSLNISNNDCLTFRVLANVTNDLQYTPIRLLDISRIHCTFGPGTVLQKTDILHLEKTNLTHVYLDSNRLAMVEVGFARLLPKTLTFISIVDNKLSFGLYDFELMTSLPNIEIIHAESEGRPHNMESGSSDCNDWRAPPSSHETISFGRSNELLNCNRNPLLKLHHNSETITTVPLPPSLREFYFSNNAMNFEIGKVKFRENNLTSIDLSNNLLHSWKGPLLNLKKLKHVDLSNNFCSYVSEDFFKGFNYSGNTITWK